MNLEAGNETERLRSGGSCEEHGPFIMQFSRAHDVQRAIGFAPTVAEKGVILMAGRKPKLTALKKLEGNPGKRQLNVKEPMPGKGIPDCPKWLFPEAKMEWERLCVKLSEMGVLTETDKGYQQQTPWVGIENTNQKLMMQAAAAFGLTPSARSRIMAVSCVGKDEEDEMEALLGGGA